MSNIFITYIILMSKIQVDIGILLSDSGPVYSPSSKFIWPVVAMI
jgi:hypothetical protein